MSYCQIKIIVTNITISNLGISYVLRLSICPIVYQNQLEFQSLIG